MPIFDQGYQHWSGRLSGHAWRWAAISRHGVRIGRRNLLLRIFLLFAWTPALVLAFMLCIWGLVERKSDLVGAVSGFLGFLAPEVLANPLHFRVEIWTLFYSRFLQAELYLSIVLILLVGPDLISQDLRFNALPLYFSRPLRRIDYFLGKLGIIAAFLAMVVIVPAIAAYILGLLFSLDLSIVRDTLPILLASILYGLVISISAGMLILALSSLSRNSRYTALFWIGILLIGASVSAILQDVDRDQRRHEYRHRADIPVERDPVEMRNWQRQQQNAQMKFQEEELNAAKSDFRPLFSYTANLSRIGEHLLRTDAAWESLSQVLPADRRTRFLIDNGGPRYPWYWSAGVLLGLFGLCACILNFRVKSLDRLK